jgi:hypothetical protein
MEQDCGPDNSHPARHFTPFRAGYNRRRQITASVVLGSKREAHWPRSAARGRSRNRDYRAARRANFTSPPAGRLRAQGRDIERRVLARAVRYHIESRVLINGSKTSSLRSKPQTGFSL